jgi:tRNA (guanine26-N2/guanine27-N2)-dimethyltransferase
MPNKDYKADFPCEIIKEGKVQALVPRLEAYGVAPSVYAPSKAPVFYNPVMEFNRDLTVLAFQAYQHMAKRQVSICDPLTSQGIRGIRFAAEIKGVKKILINDINEKAFKLAKHNVQINNLEKLVAVKHKDANCILSCHASPKKRFDIIDIDPFGSPAPYLNSAIRALRNNGLLASTATDLAPLCGVHIKACIRKYGGRPLRTEYCHELAVRLLAGSIACMAAKNDISMRVIFSHSSQHYIRVYAQTTYGAKKADESVKNLGYILHCFNCFHRETTHWPFESLQCPVCGSKMDYAGPMWLGRIFDPSFIKLMIEENKIFPFRNATKIAKLLQLTKNEAQTDITTYFVLDKLSGKLGLPSPSIQSLLLTLRDNGFLAVQTHFNMRGIRTNAPAQEIIKLLKETCTQ